MDEFGMTQVELARRMGRPPQAISEIITGNKILTASTAIELEQVLSVPAYMWSELESAYQLARARRRESAVDVERDLEILSECKFYGELAGRGLVRKTRKPRERVLELRRFWAVTELANVTKSYQPAFRLSASHKPAVSLYALAAWLREAELKATKEEVSGFKSENVSELMLEMGKLTTRKLIDLLPELRELLANVGIVLILQQSLKGMRMCGAAFWWRKKRPVVVVSDFGKAEDQFWFTLLHELAHIVLHGSNRVFVSLDNADDPGSTQQMEIEADRLAAHCLIPDDVFESFQWRSAYPTNEEIRTFSHRIEVDPGIVAGRLCKEGTIGWNRKGTFSKKFDLSKAA
ncbi:ImmA/IrrE family metallo-endopeptidase [bacterium]|nr:ImmA/IrrE family metallo-endopeptidase [bacterium]